MPIRPECNNTKVHKSTSWMTKPNPLRTRRCVSGGGRRRRLAQTEWCWKPALDVLWSIDIQQPALHWFVTDHNSRDEGVVLFGTLYLLSHLFLWSLTQSLLSPYLSSCVQVFLCFLNSSIISYRMTREDAWLNNLWLSSAQLFVHQPSALHSLPPSGSIASTELWTFWLPRYWMSCHPSWYTSLEGRILLNLEVKADIWNQRCSVSWKL